MKTKTIIILIFLVVFSIPGFSQENDVSEARKTITEFKETNSNIGTIVVMVTTAVTNLFFKFEVF